MKNYMKLDHQNRKIVMDRTFASKAEFVGSEEYNLLQQCRRDYPSYIVTRKSINKKADQEHYRGLTYDYMRNYINKYDTENKEANLAILEEMIDISKCHSTCKRYPVIKQWFLDTYEDVKKFGIPEDEETAETNNVIEADFSANANSEVAVNE